MIRIHEGQYRDLTRRSFEGRVYCFLRDALRPEHRARLGSLAEVTALWERAGWVDGASEHDLAVYLSFVWLAAFDQETARRLRPPQEALAERRSVFEMKCHLVDAGMFDMTAFDRA